MSPGTSGLSKIRNLPEYEFDKLDVQKDLIVRIVNTAYGHSDQFISNSIHLPIFYVPGNIRLSKNLEPTRI